MAKVAKVTNVGLSVFANRIKGNGTEPRYIGWGTGTTAAAVTDTTLQIPATETRVACTTSIVDTAVTGDTFQAVGIITCSGADKNIAEVGLFDAATNGNLVVRCTDSATPVSVGDSISFTIKIQQQQSA